MAIRLSGMNSGLDTDSIVTALVSGYKTKKEKYQKAQTKLSWTQDAWKALNTKVYSLYSNISNLRFSSAYSLKKTSVSDSTKATVKAGSGAPSGTQSLKIKQMAKAGYMTGAQIKADSTSKTLAQLGYTGGDAKIDIKTGDETKTITLTASSKISDVVNELKNAGLEANYDTNYQRFYISSKSTGAANDFTITGSNLNGASALYSLGIAYGGGTDGTNPYAEYANLHGSSDEETKANITAAVTKYNELTTTADKNKAQSDNLMSAISYGLAYSSLQEIYEGIGSADDVTKLKITENLGTARDSSLLVKDGDGYNVYSKITSTDVDGNAIYKYVDNDSNSHYISVVDTYADEDGNSYKKNSDGNYYTTDGTKYEGDTGKLTKSTEYYAVEETVKYISTAEDGTETVYNQNEDGSYTDQYGKVYKKNEDDGKYYTDGSEEGITISQKTEYVIGENTVNVPDVTSASEEYNRITSSMDEKTLASYNENLSSVNAFESSSDSVLSSDDPYSIKSLASAIQEAYATNNGGKDAVNDLLSGKDGKIEGGFAAKSNALADDAQKATEDAAALDIVKDLASKSAGSAEYETALNEFLDKVNTAFTLSENASYNTGINKVAGQDSEIELNGVTYTGDSNSYSINGLTIEALAETGDNVINITTSTDSQGIYDKIKDFLTEYNNIINEMTKLYNAESAGSYEPLTDDEKDEMSDSEIEKWETKIKDSLLRKDSTLGSVMTAMQNAMMSSVEINGKKYSLSSFGIHTLGYLNAAENEQNAYHIDGDEDDTNTSGNTDKLMAAINEDPDTIMQFMQKLSSSLYTAIGDKMKSTTLSSAFTIYNDKQMTTEYNSYTKTIKEWETKISDKEEYYYNKFTQMETAMAKLNSTQSSLSGYFS